MTEAKREFVIIGAGGHGKVVCDALLAAGECVSAFVDEARAGESVLGVPVLCAFNPSPGKYQLIAVGDNWAREQLAAPLPDVPPAVVHPSAHVARDVQIGGGTVIMAGAIINPGTRIGRYCIVNTAASIDHDCVLDDFASIAPGVTLGGNVTIGRGSAIGLGAKIIHARVVGEYSLVGAGSVVINDVAANAVALGVPARVIRSHRRGDPYL